MSKKDDLRIPDYLGHIVEAIEWIHRCVEGMPEVDFLDDEKNSGCHGHKLRDYWRGLTQH